MVATSDYCTLNDAPLDATARGHRDAIMAAPPRSSATATQETKADTPAQPSSRPSPVTAPPSADAAPATQPTTAVPPDSKDDSNDSKDNNDDNDESELCPDCGVAEREDGFCDCPCVGCGRRLPDCECDFDFHMCAACGRVMSSTECPSCP